MKIKSATILSIFCISSVLLSFIQNHSLGHSWMAPENAAQKKNPIQITDESINNGQAIFVDLCSSCHGLGAVGVSKEKTGLKKDTPNLSNRLKTHSDGDFHWKIKNGKGDMPSFKDELSEKEVWDVIHYIRTLKNK